MSVEPLFWERMEDGRPLTALRAVVQISDALSAGLRAELREGGGVIEAIETAEVTPALLASLCSLVMSAEAVAADLVLCDQLMEWADGLQKSRPDNPDLTWKMRRLRQAFDHLTATVGALLAEAEAEAERRDRAMIELSTRRAWLRDDGAIMPGRPVGSPNAWGTSRAFASAGAEAALQHSGDAG